jgi:erythromycin esterase-like protein
MLERIHVTEAILRQAVPLRDDADLQALVDAAGDARFVLLGEASHGTSEFYRMRAELTKRLITQKGFSFIAVEGDWPPCYEVNKYVKGWAGAKPSLDETMMSFDRWPTWMWANTETRELVRWLRSYNEKLPDNRERIGFYGLDVYSLWESMEEIIAHLEQTGAPELEAARQAFSCFEPYGREGQKYGVSAVYMSESCRNEVVKLLTGLREKRKQAQKSSVADEEAELSDELNALVVKNAETYYREMIRSDSRSWNVRDEHMTEALDRIARFYGSDAKGIVWEHNTHIGDARATDMAAEGMVNVGQLVREKYGRERIYAVGFGTHRGTVIAGKAWGAEPETMRVPEAANGSWEDLLHEAGGGSNLLLRFDEGMGGDLELFRQTYDHRAIGVVYHPGREHWGNYVPSVVAERYDAFVFVDSTEALHPLIPAHV